MGGLKCLRRLLAVVAVMTGLGAVAFAGPASAADSTTWICKPGQSDDLCAGTIDGATIPPPGQTAQPLGYTRPADPPIDCFYLYPTQSNQATPNSNLDKDPGIRRVVVQQARMFSSRCNVYAPMYRQVTSHGNQVVYSPDVQVAYDSAKAGFEDYLNNYNNGRPFVMIGHSQGAAHTARLIDEMVDTDSELRKRFVGAIAPGANIPVPIGQTVGGMFTNVPSCSKVGEFGCVTAFSTFNDQPGPLAPFSRLTFGYYPYPGDRPDATRFEVMCSNPALLDGGNGTLEPLVNFDYITGAPASETASPWKGQPDFYKVECKRQDGAHWLNLSKVGLPGDSRADLGAAIASGSNYHVPEVNLAEGNLLRIVQLQTDSYVKEQDRIAGVEAKLKTLKSSLAKSKKSLARNQKAAKKFTKKLKKATGKRRKALKRRVKTARMKATADRKRIKKLKTRITALRAQLS